MFNHKEVVPKREPFKNRLWRFTRKNGITILLAGFTFLILVSPDSKAWLLRQFMVTGIFDAGFDENASGGTNDLVTDFSFEDNLGNIQNTSSLRGKVVFINFWASWCPPCRAEFPSIQMLYSTLKENPNVFFLTLNEDTDLMKGKSYLEKEKFSVPFYTTRGDVPASIYTGTLPTTIVLDKKGIIRFRHEGFANYGSEKFVKQIEELIKK